VTSTADESLTEDGHFFVPAQGVSHTIIFAPTRTRMSIGPVLLQVLDQTCKPKT